MWAKAPLEEAAVQLPDGLAAAPAPTVPLRLMPGDVIGNQQQEAARGPPRSLHTLARDALNAIVAGPTRDTQSIDDWFPWRQYIAAHKHGAQIIGPGITEANAVWFDGDNDANRGGAPRLDFCFDRTDGTRCRAHPGKKSKQDAKLRYD